VIFHSILVKTVYCKWLQDDGALNVVQFFGPLCRNTLHQFLQCVRPWVWSQTRGVMGV